MPERSQNRRLPRTAALAALWLVPALALAESTSSSPPTRPNNASGFSYLTSALSAFPLSEGEALLYSVKLNAEPGLRPSPGLEDFVSARFATALARSGVRARTVIATSTDEALRQARTESKPLLLLEPKLGRSGVTLTITELAFARRFWERVRSPLGSPITRWRIHLPLDASLTPPQSSSSAITEEAPVATPLKDAFAADCHYFAGENEPRITLLGRRRVVSGHLLAGKFSTLFERSLEELSPLSGTPLREPLARVMSDGESFVLGTSDRQRLLRLSSTLAPLSSAARAYPLSMEQCARFVSDGIAQGSGQCGETGGHELPRGEGAPRIRAVFDLITFSEATSSLRISQSSRDSKTWVSSEGTATVLSFPNEVTPDARLVGASGSLRGTPLLFFEASGSPGRVWALTPEGTVMPFESGKAHATASFVVECPASAEKASMTILGGPGGLWLLH